MEVMVTVTTAAYNHGPYIGKALESFVTQKTNFPFEVVVHDDASTDNTAEIIREYAEKYPDIIKPIYQTENQYSKGISVYSFMAAKTRGKYIAQCEGDDYWCDEYKLQKQVDYMEAHPECSLCFSNSYDVDVDGNVIGVKEPVSESRIFTTEEILATEGTFYANASIMYRTELAKGFVESGIKVGEVGDVPLRCYFALKGYLYGFSDKMACYRRFVPGSWTMRVEENRRKNRLKFIKRCEDAVEFYNRLNAYSGGRYEDILLPKRRKYEFHIYWERVDLKKLREPEFREMFRQVPFRQRTYVYLKYYFPWAVKAFRFIRYGKKGLQKVY